MVYLCNVYSRYIHLYDVLYNVNSGDIQKAIIPVYYYIWNGTEKKEKALKKLFINYSQN